MDFLHRLAATALGESGSLRAALPARYEAMPVEPAEAEPPATQEPPHAAMPATAPAAAAGVTQPIATREAPRALSEDAAKPRSKLPDRSNETAARRPAAPTVHDRELRSFASGATRAHEQRAMPLTVAAATPSRDEPRHRDVAASLGEAPQRTPRAQPASRIAPLDPSLVALHTERPSADAPAPVIHVTIDRIDVRAPAQAPPRGDKPAAARPAPTRSLADYLRGGSR